MDLMKISESEIEIGKSIQFFFLELLWKNALFLRVLIGYSLFYVHESMLTCAVIYTCLDFLPIIVLIYYLKEDVFADDITVLFVFGIKDLLDPCRIMFKLFKDDIIHDSWIAIVKMNSYLALWYSLLGIIVSNFFRLTLDFKCYEPCDQYADRLGRFDFFFHFCLGSNVFAFLYSLITFCFTANENLSREAEIIDEETKV